MWHSYSCILNINVIAFNKFVLIIKIIIIENNPVINEGNNYRWTGKLAIHLHEYQIKKEKVEKGKRLR